jgi:hypothetical protein
VRSRHDEEKEQLEILQWRGCEGGRERGRPGSRSRAERLSPETSNLQESALRQLRKRNEVDSTGRRRLEEDLIGHQDRRARRLAAERLEKENVAGLQRSPSNHRSLPP